MTLATAIEKVRRLARTNTAGASNLTVMERINDSIKEFAKSVHGLTKEEYVSITPLFDIQTNFAIRITVTGGTNALVATDVAICATDAADQTGTQVATALQTAIRAAGPTTLTVAWSTTAWTFTIDGIDCTSITITDPTGITYASALTLLGLGDETTTATSVTSSIPTDCTVESALPTDFLALVSPPLWDGDPLAQGRFSDFQEPESTGDPYRYFIRNKNILLDPAPHEQKKLHIWYKYLPASFTTPQGYQECGLSGKRLTTATGLTASTAYYFKVNIDGGGVVEYTITTGTDVTYEPVIDLMNDQLKGATFSLEGGDLRCTSDFLGAASAIALSAGTTGTNLFATLTGWSAFDTAVATEGGTDLPIDDEWCEAVTYFAASKVAEENYESKIADRYYSQFKRICQDFITHRANNNPKMVLDYSSPTMVGEVDLGS